MNCYKKIIFTTFILLIVFIASSCSITFRRSNRHSSDIAGTGDNPPNSNVVNKVVLPNISHFAGSLGGIGADDGIGAAASFYYPNGIIRDGTNLYVADTWNNTIRKIVISTGEATTFAGSAGNRGSDDGIGTAASFYYPNGITSDGTNLYVSENVAIRKINISTGEVTTLAIFIEPMGITNDGTNLYISDCGNYTIRKIVISTGEVTTFAGTGSAGSHDGIGTDASFYCPRGITSDGINLYVTDTLNHTIRKIVTSTGEVITLAGSAGIEGSTDGTSTEARFNYPEGITNDGINLYVTDTSNHTIRKIIISTGEVTTLAGSVGIIGSTDGISTEARFNYPVGITNDGTNLYVSDYNNSVVRKIVISTGEVTTSLGISGKSGSADGIGSAAEFSSPRGMTNDGTNLYVADALNHTIRKIVISTGEVTIFAGSAGNHGSTDGIGTNARFYAPLDLTTDGINLYVADTSNNTIRKIVISTGEVITLAGTPGITGSDDGIGAIASFNVPLGITSDGTNLYVVDSYNHTIRKIVISTGEVITLAGSAGHPGSVDGIGSIARFYNPYGITNDGTNLYVADSSNNTIRKIITSTGEVTTPVGTPGITGSDDGIGAIASFNAPRGIKSDGTNLYVTDTSNNTIRKIITSTGEVTTYAGIPGHYGRLDGPSDSATFYRPQYIDYVNGALFITEDNNDIRKIE